MHNSGGGGFDGGIDDGFGKGGRGFTGRSGGVQVALVGVSVAAFDDNSDFEAIYFDARAADAGRWREAPIYCDFFPLVGGYALAGNIGDGYRGAAALRGDGFSVTGRRRRAVPNYGR